MTVPPALQGQRRRQTAPHSLALEMSTTPSQTPHDQPPPAQAQPAQLAKPVQPAKRQPWPARLHGALMPDYNPRATAYWWALVVLGSGVLVHAALALWPMPGALQLQILFGCAVAMLAGLFPVRIPGSKNSFAAGEVFIMLLLMMVGPAPAALAAAGEAFVGSARSSKR